MPLPSAGGLSANAIKLCKADTFFSLSKNRKMGYNSLRKWTGGGYGMPG